MDDRKATVDKYVGTITVRLPKAWPRQSIAWGERAEQVPDHFLRWLLGETIANLEGHEDQSITKLLGYLQTLRVEDASKGFDGPYFELEGSTETNSVRGQAVDNGIDFEITMDNDTLKVVTGEDQKGRRELIQEMSVTFIHELAHFKQIRTWENVSHPWPRTFSSGGANTGIPFKDWTPDVQAAYTEFENAGTGKAAKGDPVWRRKFKALANVEYYNPKRGVDLRGRELVSHIIELVYEWRSPERFAQTFPKCKALLDRVTG